MSIIIDRTKQLHINGIVHLDIKKQKVNIHHKLKIYNLNDYEGLTVGDVIVENNKIYLKTKFENLY